MGGRLRRLTHAHFALYRAYLEGLDEATLHAHYGVAGIDVRATRRTLATLCDTLTIAARRARHRRGAPSVPKPGSLPRDAHTGAAAGQDVPTLEAFRTEVDLNAFYSEREVVALYVEPIRPRRRRRSIGKSRAIVACAIARTPRSRGCRIEYGIGERASFCKRAPFPEKGGASLECDRGGPERAGRW
ncbi:hypothetical protein [Burkholderia diffusa]|uniref:hypothetical protein n=1 Tax=Burkholderia diffusa TaxID=488732 RepID=UPI001EF115D2|nr:hypothetical protein [Burkholderia diffusa]